MLLQAPMPRFPGGVGDFTTGSQLFGGILGALYHRERTGEGQLVDAALLRAGIWFLAQSIMQGAGGNPWALNDNGPGVRGTTELGKRRTGITDAPFKCKDGIWIHLMGLEGKRHMPATLRALNLKPEDIYQGRTRGSQGGHLGSLHGNCGNGVPVYDRYDKTACYPGGERS